jgi:hypothetical protein
VLFDVIQPVETPQGFASTSFITKEAKRPPLLLVAKLPQDSLHDEKPNEQINPKDYDYQSKRRQLVVKKAREEPDVEGRKHNERYYSYLPMLRRIAHPHELRSVAPRKKINGLSQSPAGQPQFPRFLQCPTRKALHLLPRSRPLESQTAAEVQRL